uniref:Secreted protein n=1 Tax=Pelagomonas calceolata TaxID=35677 RepID=A0A7S3ZRJ3_9STRA|mmetsp:Transcript_7412/g.20614  ORF Transcript_7412/g.20614 Transcript_7412/m.20614 type:complete len:107 (-) Transcript_7412:73-393(-)
MWRLFWCLLASVAAIREPSAEKTAGSPRPSMWRDHRHGRIEERKHDETIDTGFVQGVRLVRQDRQNVTRVVVDEGVGVRFVRHDRRPKQPANASKTIFVEDPVWLI